jgi:hypothetical protein
MPVRAPASYRRGMEAAMRETQVRPGAFEQATAVRNLGIGVTTLLSVLSGAVLAAYLIVMYVAVGLAGAGLGPVARELAVTALLAGYLLVAPPVFARTTRGTTAAVAGWWLLAAVAGYAVLWSGLGMASS